MDTAILEETIEAMGFEVVQMERGGGRNRPLLRVRIDHADAGVERSVVTVDECAAVTRALRERIEEHEGGESDWVLEVSSPGVERPLVRAKDYARFAGARIRVRGYAPLADRAKQLEGTLLGLVGDEAEMFALEIEGDRVEIPLDAVAAARLVYEWDASASNESDRAKT